MPNLQPIQVPVASESLAYEITQAMYSTLAADPNTMVGGTLGVASIRIANVVPDGSELTLNAKLVGACPELSVWCASTGAGELRGCNLEANPFDALLWLTVEHDRTRAGGYMDSGKAYPDLLRNAARLIQRTIQNLQQSWVASGTPLTAQQPIEFGDFVRIQRLKRRDSARATIPIIAYQGTRVV